jgi:glycosyltransferase involved in cell wall biosynthesis
MSWAPEGYGHETFRAYEASVCGSVPIINYPSIDRYKPLRDGEHCFYYDTEAGGLTRAIKAGLSDRVKLAGMARSARAFVKAEHTLSAVAQHIVQETLQRAVAETLS